MRAAHAPSTLTRRRLLLAIAAAAGCAAGAAGYMRQVEPRWVTVEELTIALPGLPSAVDGKRILQISDIHLSEYMSPERLADALAWVRRLTPDWLVLTGDYVGNHAGAAAGLVDTLRTLDVPIVAVLGNHDHWTDPLAVHAFLTDAGATVLVNQAIQVEAGLWLAGVDDVWSGQPDLRSALNGIPTNAITLLLAHEPDYFDTVLAAQAPVALQLSGHSHGGQVRFPSLRPDAAGCYTWAPILPYLGRRYPIGLRSIGRRQLYTNRGLGVWPIPYRFNCRPEMTLITLRAA